MLSSTPILFYIVLLYIQREKFSRITLAIGLLLRCGSRLADPHLLVVRAVTTPVRVEPTGAVLRIISSCVFVCVLGLRALIMADCGSCNKRVAKSAKALACDFCHSWHHIACGGFVETDYDIIKRFRGLGFRWFCDGCIVETDTTLRCSSQLEDKLKTVVSGALDGVTKRLESLEERLGVGDGSTLSLHPESRSFADIVRQTVREVRMDGESGTKVNDHGKTRVIKKGEVLVVKPKAAEGASAMPPPMPVENLQAILKNVPVNSCRESRSGGMVVKFPCEDARREASALIESSMVSADITVSEPKKMLPKMTLLDIPISVPDDEIISGIVDKNAKIRQLTEDGHTLSLVFTREKEGRKMAVLKLSPEVRSVVVGNDNRLFLGLSSCRVYDRFWANQCRHCQKFSHSTERCPTKNTSPVCRFCAGGHLSASCPDKSNLKCSNCSSQGKALSACQHSASSRDCPVLITERKRIMENTDFGPSKNT